MKFTPFLIIPCFFLMGTCIVHDSNNISDAKKDEPAYAGKKIDFEKDVLPVLINNCSPCHFTGGKMYEKLPFDKAATLIDNSDKIMKRVGNDEKKSVIKEFILQNKAGLSSVQAATNKD